MAYSQYICKIARQFAVFWGERVVKYINKNLKFRGVCEKLGIVHGRTVKSKAAICLIEMAPLHGPVFKAWSRSEPAL